MTSHGFQRCIRDQLSLPRFGRQWILTTDPVWLPVQGKSGYNCGATDTQVVTTNKMQSCCSELKILPAKFHHHLTANPAWRKIAQLIQGGLPMSPNHGHCPEIIISFRNCFEYCRPFAAVGRRVGRRFNVAAPIDFAFCGKQCRSYEIS